MAAIEVNLSHETSDRFNKQALIEACNSDPNNGAHMRHGLTNIIMSCSDYILLDV